MASNFSLTYNNLVLIPTNGYTIQRMEGLDGLPLRISEAPLTARDGGNIYARLYGMRTISITGTIIASDPDTYFDRKRALVQAFTRIGSSDLTITRWDTGATTRTMSAKVVQTPEIVENFGENTFANFFVQVRGEEPWLLDSNNSIEETLTLAESNGYVLPFSAPIPFGESTTTDTVTILNDGDIALPPSIVFNGPVTNPRLTNQTTNETVGITGTINNGESVVIYRNSSGVFYELNGTIGIPGSGVNYFQFKTGDLFDLAIGSNTLKFTAQTFNANASCIVRFTNGYLSL